ncbi:hypothetical protein EZV62_010727 [Acer yangbiense]|uniref:BED-type domain-containing protein n=1 Tax=Acer yangbiense TaxID=1000413 RepID=A0A5C7I2K2_9ROSI|nr:hypothetical protein EZV62_010727 [Acer yangbiense]
MPAHKSLEFSKEQCADLNMSSVPNTSGAFDANSMLKRKSNDIGWEFGQLIDGKNLDRVKCKLCGKTFSGGIYRLKEHVGHLKGNVSSCPRSTKENIDTYMERLGPMKGPNFLGSMDKFAKSTDSCSIGNRSLRHQNINESLFKEWLAYVAKWVYEAGIPFNVVDNNSFKAMVQAIGLFGPRFQPPSQWQLREPLLKKMVEKTQVALKNQEEEWKLSGWSIMTDA